MDHTRANARRATASNKKRISFKCAVCGELTDAPPTTERAKRQLCRQCFGKREDRRVNQLNELTGSQWARYSKSVEQYPDVRTANQRKHGACFPLSLAKQHIEIYTKRGELVLDPFAGVGTTLKAAVELGRRSIGIELNSEFCRMAAEELEGTDAQIICDDARFLIRHCQPESVDFILTSPPYGNLLKSVKGSFGYKWREHSRIDPIANPKPYSGEPADLGNMEYPDYLEAIREVMRQTFVVLKTDAYAAWVVKDYRDWKHKIPYVNLHGDIIAVAESVGFTLWDIRIYDQTKYRPLVVLGYPSRNYFLNIGHSYIIILRKMSG